MDSSSCALPMVTLTAMQLRNIEEELQALKKVDSLEDSFQWNAIKEEINISDCEEDYTYLQSSNEELEVNLNNVPETKPETCLAIETPKSNKSTADIPIQIIENQNLLISGSTAEKTWFHHCPKCEITYKIGTGNICSLCGYTMIYQCKKCEKLYKKYLSCYMHIRRKCYPTEVFNCNDCTFTTFLKSSLRHHIQIHIGEQKECHRCGKRLKNFFSLRSHLDYCGNKKYLECDLCKIKTLYKKSLIRHMVRHHSDDKASKSVTRVPKRKRKKKNENKKMINGDFDSYNK